MGSRVRLDGVPYFALRRDTGIEPEVRADMLLQKVVHKLSRFGKTGGIPFIGTRIGAAHPARFETDHGKRETPFPELSNLVLHLPVSEKSRDTMPETQPPFRRQHAPSVEEVETAHDILHVLSGKQHHLDAFGRNQKFEVIGIGLRTPTGIGIAVLHLRRILRILADTGSDIDFDIAGGVDKSSVTFAGYEEGNRRMSASVILTSIMVDMQFEDPPALFDRLEVQAEPEYLFPFVKRETDIGFAVHFLEADLVAVDRQIGFRHRIDGIPLRMQAKFTQ